MRLFKFIYNLGVRQENQRIRIAVMELQRTISGDRHQVRGLFDEANDKARAKEAERLRQLLIIDDEVLAILESLTRPQAEFVETGKARIDIEEN